MAEFHGFYNGSEKDLGISPELKAKQKAKTALNGDKDCPVCKVKNSLGFYHSSIIIELGEHNMYTPDLVWYACQKCDHSYVDADFEVYYDRTMKVLVGRAKVRDSQNKKKLSKTTKIVISVCILSALLYSYFKLVTVL